LISNEIVTNSGVSVDKNIASFFGASGILIQDSGISASSISGGPFLQLAGGTMAGDIDMNNNDIIQIDYAQATNVDVTNLLQPNAIFMGGDLDMNTHDITNAQQINVNKINSSAPLLIMVIQQDR